MFYKKENDNTWVVGATVTLPTGEYLTEDNKLELDGWKWYDNPPQEYLDYIQRMEDEMDELDLIDDEL